MKRPVVFIRNGASRLAASVLLCGCASPALQEADRLASAGHDEQALQVLDRARQLDPADNALRAAQYRQRDTTVAGLASQAEAARLAGQFELARSLLARLDALDAASPRARGLHLELDRADRERRLIDEARRAFDAGRLADAQAALAEVLVESPGLPAARTLQQRIRAGQPEPPAVESMGPAFQKRLSLEFREAPLRSVLEAIGRTSGVNFIFDKDVRAEAKITVHLKDVTLDEALRVILVTQALDRQLLNGNSLLIYPNTPAKQQEHQELATRSFYLANADVKAAQTLVKTMTKTRDVYVDERLNLLIVRDTPEVLRLTERLLAAIDLPEPEVMLEVEVMEISSNRLDAIGLQWPDTVQYGVPNFVGQVTRSDRGSFRTSIANPALVASLNETSGTANLIANPRLRARNHEKARVQIGERLPVFTSTAIVNAGVATSVSYVETGLKLEVEPSVQLDNDVVMKVNLEVSNLIGQVTGPQGSIAYRVGTRNATTSLRLHDGETEVLAGLINDEDRKSIQGIPGASQLPLLGRLFGVHNDTRNKTEVVLLITPRVVRNLGLPDATVQSGPAGSYASPGAASVRMGPAAKVAIPMTSGNARAAATNPAAGADDANPGLGAAAPDDAIAVLAISTSGQVRVGETVSVTLQNRSAATVQGQLGFDAALFEAVSAGDRTGNGFTLEPNAQKVFVLRALPGGAGKSVQVQVDGLAAALGDGRSLPVRLDGDGAIAIIAR